MQQSYTIFKHVINTILTIYVTGLNRITNQNLKKKITDLPNFCQRENNPLFRRNNWLNFCYDEIQTNFQFLVLYSISIAYKIFIVKKVDEIHNNYKLDIEYILN